MYFFKELRQAAMLSCVLLGLCGIAYPVALTSTATMLAPEKAAGSLIRHNGKAVGSAIVGQTFTAPYFLKSRPSAVNYNIWTQETKDAGNYSGVASGSANMGATNPALLERVTADRDAFLAANPTAQGKPIPADLLTASGSGLDPHISPQAASIQLPAIAQHSRLSLDTLEAIVAKHTTHKLWGIFGEDVVNVLNVNLDILKSL